MSGLTKKSVYADETLSSILGVKEGELVSYAQLSKGLHEYIKHNHLRSPQPLSSTQAASPLNRADIKKCKDCGEEIPVSAIYCDLCGVSQ